MKFRKAKEQDKETFVDIYLKCFINSERDVAQELFEEKLSNPMEGFVLLAEEEDVVVGVVAVDIIDLMGHIVGLSVVEEHRKRGVGTALVRAAIETSTKFNRNIHHMIMTGEEPTVKIGKKLGFVASDKFLLVKYL